VPPQSILAWAEGQETARNRSFRGQGAIFWLNGDCPPTQRGSLPPSDKCLKRGEGGSGLSQSCGCVRCTRFPSGFNIDE